MPASARDPELLPAAPLRAQAATSVGDAGSADSVARLKSAVADLRRHAVVPLLQHAVQAIREGDWRGGSRLALQALEADEESGLAWHLLAICLEKTGDVAQALDAYETALKLNPDEVGIANDLGRLAHRLGQCELAEKLFHHFLARQPGHVEATNNLACAQRDMNRYGDAVDTLRGLLLIQPEEVILWNTLATVLSEQGDMTGSLTFFDEALRLDPAFAKARYNRANAVFALGRYQEALDEMDAALPGAAPGYEHASMQVARSNVLMALGRLGEGMDAYEARFDASLMDAVIFVTDRPRWRPGDDLRGKRVLIVGEQGLGDEVLFANVLPDVIEAIGPEGVLHLAVEKRLVPLFQRSFPEAKVAAHRTHRVDGRTMRFMPFDDHSQIDLWSPIASLWRVWRRDAASFPARERFLAPAPERVAHWRAQLDSAGAGRKVGLLWKSLKLDGSRARYFSPFDQWKTVLEAEGCLFVNLQYGDCSAELEAAAAAGLTIWNPPGIDLKDDLDDLAALCCALDLVVGPSNATTNIAAASGAAVWMITTPDAWPRLSTEGYPAYPQVRVFHSEAFDRWDLVLGRVAEALAAD
ncbi:MAG TPA: tetratricopeptide repeat protein [Caulobacteraceae bacterium]|jgi:tetratricopeptide (TPR) repeat protein